MEKVVIKNIGKLVSGDFNKGILDATAILIKNGKIEKIGAEDEIDVKDAEISIDVNGMVVAPGFIDPHVHLSFEDYAPMQGLPGGMEDALLSGTTTMISEGEQGPGLPRYFDNDPLGVKATAILARKVFEKYRPGGALKVHGGAVVLAKGLTEEDFKEMANAGVWLVAEIGGGGFAAPLEEVLPMVELARKYKMFVSIHWGPGIIPGSTRMMAKEALEIAPNKIAHFNGGTTATPWEENKKIIEESKMALEPVSYGNPKMTHRIVEELKKRDELNRLLIGSDSPTGQGMFANAISRGIVGISAMNDIPAEKAIAMGTGNTADLYGLANTGKIEEGREADIIAIDCPPDSVGKNALEAIQVGDMVGVAMVMVDGRIVGFRGKDNRPTTRHVKINGVDAAITDIEEYLFHPHFATQRIFWDLIRQRYP